ncbi:uncharacterized protein [Patagioenas fasciata]|uniref:uncharacterized protein n=1 Tax=Patagioenas fasciata TaxID=372321 RepID=UPI003A98D23C
MVPAGRRPGERPRPPQSASAPARPAAAASPAPCAAEKLTGWAGPPRSLAALEPAPPAPAGAPPPARLPARELQPLLPGGPASPPRLRRPWLRGGPGPCGGPVRRRLRCSVSSEVGGKLFIRAAEGSFVRSMFSWVTVSYQSTVCFSTYRRHFHNPSTALKRTGLGAMHRTGAAGPRSRGAQERAELGSWLLKTKSMEQRLLTAKAPRMLPCVKSPYVQTTGFITGSDHQKVTAQPLCAQQSP